MTQEYVHPSFPQPKEDSCSLWRYMDSFKFEWLVTCERLYMTRTDHLGDPLEGTTPEGHLKWWNGLMDNSETEEQKNIYHHNKIGLSNFAAKFRSNYYVSCWHLNQEENLNMWQRYTKTKNAVAIKTSYSALRDALPSFAYIGMVRYIKYQTQALPTLNLLENIAHKDASFAWEQEVRAVVFPPASPELGRDKFFGDLFESESEAGLTIYAPIIDLQLIHTVVLHPEASAEFRANVTSICAARGIPAPKSSGYDHISASNLC